MRIDWGDTKLLLANGELGSIRLASWAAEVLVRTFISSYCRVLSSGLLLAYRYVSIHEFHWPTATKSATVAMTGMHSGITIFLNMAKSLAPSIFADSCKLYGKLSMNDLTIIIL